MDEFLRVDPTQDIFNSSDIIAQRFKYISSFIKSNGLKNTKVIILFDEVDKFLTHNDNDLFSSSTPNHKQIRELISYIHQHFGNESAQDKNATNLKCIFATNTNLLSFFPDQDSYAFLRKIKTVNFGSMDGYAMAKWCHDSIVAKENNQENYEPTEEEIEAGKDFIANLRVKIFESCNLNENDQRILKDIDLSNQYTVKLLEFLSSKVEQKHQSVQNAIKDLKASLEDNAVPQDIQLFFNSVFDAELKREKDKTKNTEAHREITTRLDKLIELTEQSQQQIYA